MTTSPMKQDPVSFTHLSEIIERSGRDGVAELAAGAFLLEVPTETPKRLAPVGSRGAAEPVATPSSRWTEEYDKYDLLELRRVRGAGGAEVYPLLPNTTAGRSKTCFLQVGEPDQTAVSKKHALFSKIGERWSLTDLGSTNGTFINRKPLAANEPQLLRPLDRLQLGDKRFVFLETNDLYALLTPVTTHDPIAIESMATELESLGSRHFMIRHEGSYLLVDLVAKPNRDFTPQKGFPLVGATSFLVGRTRPAELIIPHRSVSKQHARVFQREDSQTWWVEDVGSSYGTEKNGQRLEKGEALRLVPWDSLAFGDTNVRALFVDPAALLEFLTERGKR